MTGRDYAQRDGLQKHSDWVRRQAVALTRKGVIDYAPTGKTRGKVKAAIDYERWIVYCPDVACNGAELVEMDEPQFFCLSCGNSGNKGDYYAVEFPTPQERVKIYEELGKRPMNRPPNKNKIAQAELSKPADHPMLSRSWKPGEKVGDLKQQREFVAEIKAKRGAP